MNHLAGSPFLKLTAIVDLGDERSLSSWYSSMQFFCIFILGAIFVYHKYRNDYKSFLLIPLPIIFLLMSIDESIQIHEWLGAKSDIFFSGGSRIGTAFHATGIWMFIIGIPFLALFLLYLYSIKTILSDKLFNLKMIIIGMCVLLSGALGLELLSNFIENKNYMVMAVLCEEGLEMIGATIILWSVYDMALEYMPCMDQKNI
jgi:hypothetical protein